MTFTAAEKKDDRKGLRRPKGFAPPNKIVAGEPNQRVSYRQLACIAVACGRVCPPLCGKRKRSLEKSMQLTDLSKTDSIIFDLDGTLWDASEACATAWNLALRKVGYGNHVITVDTVKSFSGIKIEKVLTDFFSFMPAEHHKALLENYRVFEAQEMRLQGGNLYPSVTNVLSELKKTKRLYIVSNCLKGYIENFIAFNHFDSLFDGFESSDNTGKPKRENIRKIATEQSLVNPIYVGDTSHDDEACRMIKIPFVYASYGFGMVEHTRYEIADFADLLKIIEPCGIGSA